jgi:hypothetical protein
MTIDELKEWINTNEETRHKIRNENADTLEKLILSEVFNGPGSMVKYAFYLGYAVHDAKKTPSIPDAFKKMDEE